MKNTILVAAATALCLCAFTGPLYPQAARIEGGGCYCGGYPNPTIEFACMGSGTTLEKSVAAAQLDYWNEYASIFTSCLDYGSGRPNNGRNEINTFITVADVITNYGLNLTGFLGYTIIIPKENFGSFDDCAAFTYAQCGPYTETDICIIADAAAGWTTDTWDTARNSVQATVLHEAGHAWGAHHVFNTSTYGGDNAFSVMNYVWDPAMLHVARMDAETIQVHYPGQKRYVTDVGIFPLKPGQGKYSETYTTAETGSVPQQLVIGRFFLQNLGTSDASNVQINYYLSTDTDIDGTDYFVGQSAHGTVYRNSELTVGPVFLGNIPPYVANGYYYVGAIVTVNGIEDLVTENNRFFLYSASSPNKPTGALKIYRSGSSAPQPTPNPVPTPGPPTPDECCVIWCGSNYVELSISPSSISSGGALSLKYNGSYADVNFGSDPVNVYLAIIKDPVASGEPSTVDEVLSGGTVWLFTNGMNGNYLYQGRVYEPTWKSIRFGPSAPSGELNFYLTAPPGEYVFATAFVNVRTGEFIRTDEPVENSDTFRVD